MILKDAICFHMLGSSPLDRLTFVIKKVLAEPYIVLIFIFKSTWFSFFTYIAEGLNLEKWL